ncbi:hypothetical protein GCM10010430_62260 [Kitasatospora cystarginea]|uniref:Tryptophan 2,3-dioxygenase n=1 Tax=Kitasatospora cystarginea TaxID=58350 RepID=A0ABP5RND9_9ACTN
MHMTELGLAGRPGGPQGSGEDRPIGVGGAALAVGTPSDGMRALRRAHEAVCDWSHRMVGSGSFGSFPYRAVVDYYRQVGKARVSPELVALLRGLSVRIGCSGRGRPWSSPDAWLFDSWLPLTLTDRPMAYDTYAGHELLQVAHWEAGDPERSEDLLMAALLADLAQIELEALGFEPNARQRTRTVSVLQALARLTEYAPATGVDTAPLAAVREVLAARGGDEVLLRAGAAAAAAVRDRVPEPLARAVDIGLLPVTTMHDEQMFIRCIQLFERLFARLASALTDAVEAVRLGRPAEAAAGLSAAADRLAGATAPLYRILTTMPPEAFAVIRDHTHGASAIQSRPYQMIELVSAKREDGPYSAEKGPRFTVVATLQEEFLQYSGGWRTEETRLLQEAMVRLDGAWRAMKRTHWGVTLKIIGKVPGTGGTAGAEYLKAAASVPLFPLLATV